MRHRLFFLGCTIIAMFGSHPLMHDTRIGLALVRFFYRLLCALCTQPGEPIGEVRDLSLSRNNGFVKVRMHRPLGAKGRIPAILFIHGGCFCVGDLDTHDAMARAIANASACAVFTVDYRRSPEHRFPAAADDAYDVLYWIDRNAEQIGVDNTRLVIMGDSAGAAIACTVAQWARDFGAPKINLQLFFYPMTDATMRSDSWNRSWPVLNKSVIQTAWARYSVDGKGTGIEAFSPLERDLHWLPPSVVLTAECDPLAEEGIRFVTKLRESGNSVRHIDAAGAVHGFLQVPHSCQARQYIEELGQTIKAYTLVKKPVIQEYTSLFGSLAQSLS